MLFLGIDQSFTSTGMVKLDEKGNLIDFTVIKGEKSKGMQKFYNSWEMTNKILTFCKDVDFVALEDLSFGSFGDATRDLAGLQFTVVQRLIFELNIKPQLIPVKTNKKFAKTQSGNENFKGKIEKKHMIEWLPEDIKQKFKQKYKTLASGLPDLADAYWISCHLKNNQ